MRRDGAISELVSRAVDCATPESVRTRAKDVASLVEARGDGLNLGDQLGPYELIEVLGSGGQASVYKARHTKLDRVVALKIPHGVFAERLLREARMLAKLEHAHIVRVEHIELEGDLPYLVLEYCDGGTLAERLNTCPDGLALADVESISSAVLQALSAAHAKGIVHRDIKPSNVLFAADGTAKVCDFGIGTGAIRDELAGSLVSVHGTSFAGTPLYMAPEQSDESLRVDGKLDGRTDLYAFGKLLYAMLTGRSPRTFRQPSQCRQELSTGWDALVTKLTEERPEDRYATVSDVLVALGRASAGGVRSVASGSVLGEEPDGAMVAAGDLAFVTPAFVIKMFAAVNGLVVLVGGFTGYVCLLGDLGPPNSGFVVLLSALAYGLGIPAAFVFAAAIARSKLPSLDMIVLVQLLVPITMAAAALCATAHLLLPRHPGQEVVGVAAWIAVASFFILLTRGFIYAGDRNPIRLFENKQKKT